jgi:hypothetical protein
LAAGATVSIVPQTVPPTPFPGTQAGSGAITLLVEDQDGKPLPNAPVLLTTSGGADPTNGARPDGSLTFENVSSIAAPCAYVFSYQSARFTQSGCLGPQRVTPWKSVTATLRLSPGAAAVPQMQLGAVVVTVRDPAGHPLPNVFISVAVNMDINTHYATDAEGRYIFLQPAGVPTLPVFFEPGSPYASVQLQPLTVQPGEVKQLSVSVPVASPPTVSPAAAASGRGWIDGGVFLAGTTTPVAGAIVKIAATALASGPLSCGVYQFPALSVTSGANGGPTYTVTIVPPPGYVVVGPASQTVTVTVGHGVTANFFVRSSAATTSPPCQFVLGFAALRAAVPTVVGDCLEDEQHNPVNGDGLQHTTNGLLVWRKVDNFTAFTDGYHTWVNGPSGIQERLTSRSSRVPARCVRLHSCHQCRPCSIAQGARANRKGTTMARIVIHKGNTRVIGPHLGPINWRGLHADIQQLRRKFLPAQRLEQSGMPACCSFCGKDHRGRRLIGGPNHLFICNECIASCQSMLDESPGPRPRA